MSDPHSLVAVDAAVGVLYHALAALIVDPKVSVDLMPPHTGSLYRVAAVYQQEREQAKAAA